MNQDAKLPSHAVDGVVLAAGRSSRMGTSKPALDAGGAPFIERAVVALRDGGCRDVLAVIGPDDGVAGAVATQAGARIVMNTARESEQIDSLRLALRNLMPGTRAVVVLPVDHPLATSATVRAVIEAWLVERPPVARATHQGAPGHPTLFAESVFEELLSGELADGARTVVAAHERELLDVPVDDAGVTIDVDTPEDYRRAFGGDA